MVAVVVALCAGRLAVAAPAGADVVVVIDRSMAPEKLEVVTRALGGVASAFSADDRLAVIAFARSAQVEAPLEAAGPKLAARFAAITYAEGGTVTVGLRAAYDLLARSKRANKQVVLISERELDPARPILDKLRVAGVTVIPVAYQTTAAVRSVANPEQLRAVVTSMSTRIPPRPSMAVVFVIDRSGSMKGPKLDAAKELARTTLEVLDSSDMFAVVAFDSEVSVAVRPQYAANRARISADIARIETEGGTNIYVGLKEAFEILKAINAEVKEVVLLTDGEAPADGIVELVEDMHTARISVTAVGLAGADRNLLSEIAHAGAGRLYMAEDAAQLPRIFMMPPGIAP
jgi:Mg-chelatase subunit ChlD